MSQCTLNNAVDELRRDGQSTLDIAARLATMADNLRQDGVAIAKERMSACFDRQIKIFDDVQYWQGTGLSKTEFMDLVLPLKPKAEAKAEQVHPNNVPCVIVDGGLLSLYSQMALIELDGERGRNYLNPRKLVTVNGLTVPDSLFYLAIDVETGERRKKISPNNNDRAFVKEGRQRLVVAGGIAVVRYEPAVLKQVFIDCTGSRFDSSGVPNLILYDGVPRLSAYWDPDDAYSHWGAGSCREYLGV